MRRACLLLVLGLAGCQEPAPPSRRVTSEPVLLADPPLPSTAPSRPSPPPLSGGTLLVTRSGQFAVAADPDRDLVWIVSLVGEPRPRAVQLLEGAQPGRLVEDTAGRVHVVLRGHGAVVAIDPDSGTAAAERRICAEPRGIAHDDSRDVLLVACAEGKLVTLGVAGGPASAIDVPPDVRDVVLQNRSVYLSSFRSAEILTVFDGVITGRTSLPRFTAGGTVFTPAVAWRMIGTPAGLAVIHQRARVNAVAVEQGGSYGSTVEPCSGALVGAALSTVSGVQVAVAPSLSGAVLPIDVARSASGAFAVVSAGTRQIWRLDGAAGPDACTLGADRVQVPSEPVAVAFRGEELLVQTREPAQLWIGERHVDLPGERRGDLGHHLFHSATALGVACASCHPEGGEDGHLWTFSGVGPRRTQSLAGGVTATAPFHWEGDFKDLGGLLDEVLVRRMSGDRPGRDEIDGLGRFLDAIPRRAPLAVEPAAAARGEALFHSPAAGCAGCHSGPALTNNSTVDVGTGAAFQVPSLRGVGQRGPWMHDGCAATLAERFGRCGGGDRHGHTSQLTAVEVGDLVAYLQAL